MSYPETYKLCIYTLFQIGQRISTSHFILQRLLYYGTSILKIQDVSYWLRFFSVVQVVDIAEWIPFYLRVV